MKVLSSNRGSLIVEVVTQDGSVAQLLPVDASAAGSAPRIFWRPDGADGALSTWAEVYAAIGVQHGAVIYCDQITDYPIPASLDEDPTEVYDLRGARFVSPIGSTVNLLLADGGVLDNLGGLDGSVTLVTAQTVDPALTFSSSAAAQVPVFLDLLNTAQLVNQGTVPACSVDPAGGVPAFFVRMTNGAKISGSAAVFSLAASGILYFLIWASGGSNLEIDDDTISSVDGTAAAGVLQDGTYQPTSGTWPTFAGYSGTFTNNAMGSDGGIGPSARRPSTIFGGPEPGCRYYDTDLAAPLWFDGALWRYDQRKVAFASGTVAGSGTATFGPYTLLTNECPRIDVDMVTTGAGAKPWGPGVGITGNGVVWEFYRDSGDDADTVRVRFRNVDAGDQDIRFVLWGTYAPNPS